jgi:tetratricopeptide (TPR) repeat protein
VSPDDEAGLTNLCSIYFHQARYADAVAMCQRVVGLRPGDARAWGNLAFSLQYSANPEPAASAFRKAISLAESDRAAGAADVDLLAQLATYYAAVGERGPGRERLEEAVALGPVNPDRLANIAEAFEDLGDRERALEWAAKALTAGATPDQFERRPALRGLVADPEFRNLAESRRSSGSPNLRGAER